VRTQNRCFLHLPILEAHGFGSKNY
jgi:hypothetical protein